MDTRTSHFLSPYSGSMVMLRLLGICGGTKHMIMMVYPNSIILCIFGVYALCEEREKRTYKCNIKEVK